MKEVELNIKKGEFVCIIGDVASGKSNLLCALNGELIYTPKEFHDADSQGDAQNLTEKIMNFEIEEAPVKINGSKSFVEPKSWIRNATIREIITFGQEYNEKRFEQTIAACQLVSDLEMLPAGDLTEIGERGINLSGGQKARISLARAVYANKDIIVMDDPISALDANVRKNIFKQVFVGLCKDKTRILVTHAIDFIHLCDKIVMMKDGRISAQGNLRELADNEQLKEILSAYNAQKEATLQSAENVEAEK